MLRSCPGSRARAHPPSSRARHCMSGRPCPVLSQRPRHRRTARRPARTWTRILPASRPRPGHAPARALAGLSPGPRSPPLRTLAPRPRTPAPSPPARVSAQRRSHHLAAARWCAPRESAYLPVTRAAALDARRPGRAARIPSRACTPRRPAPSAWPAARSASLSRERSLPRPAPRRAKDKPLGQAHPRLLTCGSGLPRGPWTARGRELAS